MCHRTLTLYRGWDCDFREESICILFIEFIVIIIGVTLMAEEESTQKMESLILELNKSGLAYLVSSTSFTIQINLGRLWIISRKPKRLSLRS